MTKTKSTKRALLMSMLSMLLCIAMLVGSTFAWFTDSVTSGNNKIVAGNLDVELEYATADDAKDGTIGVWTKVDDDTDSLFAKDALWEPGYTEVVYLRVKNAGTLALKYKLGINVAENVIGKTAKGDDIDLTQYIKFGVAEGATGYTDRAAARAAVEETAVKLASGYAGEAATLEQGEYSDTLALVVYMPEDVGNEANYGLKQPSISLGINLVATQATFEEDSFDNLYDKDATYPEVETGTTTWYDEATAAPGEPVTEYTVTSASELAGLAKLVNEGTDFTGKTVKLAGDIALDGVSNWVPIGSAEHPFNGTFDGAGHTVSGLYIDSSKIDNSAWTIGEQAGFFGHISGATVKGLTVEGKIIINDKTKIDITHQVVLGGIASTAENSTIDSCTNKVTIDASGLEGINTLVAIGGIVGCVLDMRTSKSVTIRDCVNEANLTATTKLGVAGGILCSIRNVNVHIEGCLNKGELTGLLTGDIYALT